MNNQKLFKKSLLLENSETDLESRGLLYKNERRENMLRNIFRVTGAVLPLMAGVSDGLGYNCLGEYRLPIYVGSSGLIAASFPPCPPANIPMSSRLGGGPMIVLASYWLGRGVGTLIDKIN